MTAPHGWPGATRAGPQFSTATVTVDGGSLLRTEVAVTWPGTDDAQRLVARAKTLCPYAKLR